MFDLARYRIAAQAAAVHSVCTVLVAAAAAWLVFGVWYAYPYRELSGGRELFLLVVAVDVVCGPLLTFVLFNPEKSRRELCMDLGLVAIVQLAALGYGMWTVLQARPLFLVHEVDRFKVVSAPDLAPQALDALTAQLKPKFWMGPQTVGIRPPKSVEEHNNVLFEAAAGGRDYAERPDFYVPFDAAVASKTLERSKAVRDFAARYPQHKPALENISALTKQPIEQMRYLPIRARKDWIAVLTPTGQIAEFVPGDGF
jgi:hypothetical protein